MKVYLYYILTGAFRSRSAPEVVVIRLRFRGCATKHRRCSPFLRVKWRVNVRVNVKLTLS